MSTQYGSGPGSASASANPPSTTDCGGCSGLGAHRRWCPEIVGPRASLLGRHAERAEDLADAIGSLDTLSANDCYRIAGRLRAAAWLAAEPWQKSRDAAEWKRSHP